VNVTRILDVHCSVARRHEIHVIEMSHREGLMKYIRFGNKLTLNAETVRHLRAITTRELRHARGGGGDEDGSVACSLEIFTICIKPPDL